MKIAFLSMYGGIMYRGVEIYVHELANRLVSKEHDVTVFQNGNTVPGALYKTVSLGIEFDYTAVNTYIPFLSYWTQKVREFTSKALGRLDRTTDIVVATNGQWQSVLSRLWTLKFGKKLVIPGQSGPGLDDRINLWTFPDVFVSFTEFQKKWAEKINPFVKIQKIPNGADLKLFNKDGTRISVGLPKPIIVYVAALEFYKRQDLAIGAISKLKTGSLLLVGKGPKEKYLTDLGRELLPKRLKIMALPYSRMPEIYRSADLFTFPTRKEESFGMAVIEAMASGLPVVATRDPIRSEIVGNAGILVDPADTDSYAGALEKALSMDWGNKPRKQAEKFGWDEIAMKYEKLFRETVK